MGEEIWCEAYYRLKSFEGANNAGFKILKNCFYNCFLREGEYFAK